MMTNIYSVSKRDTCAYTAQPVYTLKVRFLLVKELKAFLKINVQNYVNDCFHNF